MNDLHDEHVLNNFYKRRNLPPTAELPVDNVNKPKLAPTPPVYCGSCDGLINLATGECGCSD